MQNAMAMSLFERPGNLGCQMHSLLLRKWTLKRFSVDILQHQVVRPNIVDLADVGMIQRRNGSGLLLEPVAVGAIKELECDNAIEPRIAGLVDFARRPRRCVRGFRMVRVCRQRRAACEGSVLAR